MSADLNAIKARHAARVHKRGQGDGTVTMSTLMDHDIGHLLDHNAALTQALEEVRDALDSHEMRYEYRNAERDAVANIRTVLERRMGADWLNGRGA